jgi:hypothetical protein
MQGVVGATIKKARTELGLSQAAFAPASVSAMSPSAGEIRPYRIFGMLTSGSPS